MGCDIHMMAEKKDLDTDRWEPVVEAIFKADLYFPKDEISLWNTPYTYQPVENRNYELFSVLANVRNGYDTKPICEPRGFPDNIHQVTAWLLTEHHIAEHSLSWLTLDDIEAYDWKLPSRYNPGQTLEESCKHFLESCKVLRRIEKDDYCTVRLVFGFDN